MARRAAVIASACLSQFRMVWAEGFEPAAELFGERPERASSMSRARSCGGYGGRVFVSCTSFPRGSSVHGTGQVQTYSQPIWASSRRRPLRWR